jgi:aminoglycoside phosphotransferase (APT) family kinase protein
LSNILEYGHSSEQSAKPNTWLQISLAAYNGLIIGDMSSIDQSGPVRPGEELDIVRLASYLKQHLPELDGPLVVEQFPSGFSNLTYLLRIGEREVVLRRPPIGAKIKTAHDMSREYRILSHLYPAYRKVPRPLIYCDDDSVIGAPFYVMERVKGIILRAEPPAGVELTQETMRSLSTAFIDNLLEIHHFDYQSAGLSDLGSPEGYVKRQVDGWTKRYYNARTSEVVEVERIARWLLDHQPADSSKSALIHNDYKYDNLVLSPNDFSNVLAVLDWEMATIGDPLMDLGTTLGYWVEATDSAEWQQYGFVLTRLPGNLTRGEIAKYYAQKSGRDVTDPVFYYVYGLMKIAVIVQQIYFRYREGFTKDPRFAGLDRLVKACGIQAQRALEKGRVDNLNSNQQGNC